MAIGQSERRDGIKVFVVDDEPGARDVLAADLRKMPCVAEVQAFASYVEATFPLLDVQPDVLFLDVEMPGKTGIEFLESVRRHITFPLRVVFYTAYSNYMIDAIRQQAFDFLLKPYKLSELDNIMARLLDKNDPIGIISHPTLSHTAHRKIAIQTVRELLLLSIESILMFLYSKDTRSWFVLLTDGMKHRLHQGTNANDLLDIHASLVRINSNTVINITYLSAVENNTLRCKLIPPYDDMELYASRRYFSRLKELFELY